MRTLAELSWAYLTRGIMEPLSRNGYKYHFPNFEEYVKDKPSEIDMVVL